MVVDLEEVRIDTAFLELMKCTIIAAILSAPPTRRQHQSV